MTSKAALIMALLGGRVLSIINCFKETGLSNIGREVPRLIEKPFEVEVSRTAKAAKNRYGQPVYYTTYRLNRSEHNLPGIQKMTEYLAEHVPTVSNAKTEGELFMAKQVQQLNLL